MKRALPTLTGTPGLLLTAFVLGTLAHSYATAETRGTVPLERLTERGTPLERAAAREVADVLRAEPQLPSSWKWYATRTRSADGDTISFRIYRAKDARFPRRMLLPEPVIAGGARYVISTGTWWGPGIGVR
jgi:hypothetical protein